MLRLDVTGRVETSNGDVWLRTRTLVDGEGRAAVWLANGGRNTLAWSGRVTFEDQGPWKLIATDGTILSVQVERDCGCSGSRLSALSERDLAALDIP